MSEEENPNGWLSIILHKIGIQIAVVVLILALTSLLSLRSFIEGESDHFVHQIVERLEKVQQSTKGELPSSIALEIRQEFAKTTEELHQRAVLYELLVHLVIAGIVALVLLFLVDSQVKRLNQRELSKFRKEITDNVWQAICARFVPKEVIQQVEGILQLNFVKQNARYVITLDAIPGQLMGNLGEEYKFILLKRVLTFSVHNISGRNIVYPFRSQIISTTDKQKTVHITMDNQYGFKLGENYSFPRHEHLSIGDTEQTIEKPDDPDLSHSVNLKPQGTCEISHTCFELMRLSDDAYYIQVVPLVGLDVTVHNLIPHRIALKEIYISHPESEAFVQKPIQGDAKRFVFEEKAILPGQVFSVRWREIVGEAKEKE